MWYNPYKKTISTMANKEIINYIREATAINNSKEIIEKNLLEAGWEKWDIDAAFSFIELEDLAKAHHEVADEDLVKPVVDKIETINDYACDLLKKGWTREEIYSELLRKGFDQKEVKRIFYEKNSIFNNGDGEKTISPSLALGFIILALAFFSFVVASWQNLSDLLKIWLILFFCLFYFFSGVYLRLKKGLIAAGEICYLFSISVLGLGIFLFVNYYLPNLDWVDISALWMFSGMLLGIITRTKKVLKLSVLIGLIPAIGFPFMMIKNGEGWFDISLIVVYACLLFSIIMIRRNKE
jgi:uncharacterized protein (UPF0335 family)